MYLANLGSFWAQPYMDVPAMFSILKLKACLVKKFIVDFFYHIKGLCAHSFTPKCHSDGKNKEYSHVCTLCFSVNFFFSVIKTCSTDQVVLISVDRQDNPVFVPSQHSSQHNNDIPV